MRTRIFVIETLISVSALGLGIAGCSADQGEAQPPLRQVETTTHPTAPSSTPLAASAPTPEASIAPKPCAGDGECAPGFCDRGVCAALGKANFGRACDDPPRPELPPAPPPPRPGEVWGRQDLGYMCHAYRCIDHRCRSCISDAECTPGQTICKTTEGFPGRRCGAPPKAETPAPAASPPVLPSTMPGRNLYPAAPLPSQ